MTIKDPYPWSLAKPVILDNILMLALSLTFMTQISSYLLGRNAKADIAGAIVMLFIVLLKHRHESFFSKNPYQADLISGSFPDLAGLIKLAKIRGRVASKLPLIAFASGIFILLNKALPISEIESAIYKAFA